MNIAVLLAGGTGKRMEQDIPKQFLCVEDKPIIIYTLERFQNNKNVDKILVVSLDGWEKATKSYANQFNITKLIDVITGGENRFLSIFNAINYLRNISSLEDVIIVYDSNRPLISNEIIDDAIVKCKEFNCSAGALECYDSMFISSNNVGILDNTIDRRTVFRGTGPDCVKLKLAVELFDEFYKNNNTSLTITEMLISKGINVPISKSSSRCMKITTKEDLDFFRALQKCEDYKWLK